MLLIKDFLIKFFKENCKNQIIKMFQAISLHSTPFSYKNGKLYQKEASNVNFVTQNLMV